MKFYTIRKDNTDYVAVGKNSDLLTLESLGIKVVDMQDLINRYDELKDVLTKALGEDIKPVKDYCLLSPITIPAHDVICLGANYYDHINEISDLGDFSKKEPVFFQKE